MCTCMKNYTSSLGQSSDPREGCIYKPMEYSKSLNTKTLHCIQIFYNFADGLHFYKVLIDLLV